MKQKEVFKKIGGIIKELSEQYEYLETVVDNLNDLELELFVSNAHFLTDHIEILCKLNLQNRPKRSVSDKPESFQQKFFEPVVQQLKPGADLFTRQPKPPLKPAEAEVIKPTPEPELILPKKEEKLFEPFLLEQPEVVEEKPAALPVKFEEPVIEIKEEVKPEPVITEEQPTEQTEESPVAVFDFTSNTHEDSYSVMQEQPEVIRHELVLDEAETFEPETQPVIEEPKAEDKPIEIIEEPVKEEPKAEEKQVTATLEKESKKDEPEVLTLNQKISSQLAEKSASKSDQLSVKPISDLKLAITLNDKLLYVKDLFNGYNLAYSEAIEILNRFSTFEEAQRFLRTNYVTKNNWESKQATADKFYALLKRRYA